MRKRKFLTTNSSSPIDRYPTIDKYIPEAIEIANKTIADTSSDEWSEVYSLSMNDLLVRDGLRVL